LMQSNSFGRSVKRVGNRCLNPDKVWLYGLTIHPYDYPPAMLLSLMSNKNHFPQLSRSFQVAVKD
jgi:hypothetical protein